MAAITCSKTAQSRFRAYQSSSGRPLGQPGVPQSGAEFGPVMAMAATTTIAQVAELVPLGQLDPENVVTPGIFVQRLVCVPIPLP